MGHVEVTMSVRLVHRHRGEEALGTSTWGMVFVPVSKKGNASSDVCMQDDRRDQTRSICALCQEKPTIGKSPDVGPSPELAWGSR